MNDPPRRGWRETVEAGLYRAHRLRCASSHDRRPGRRCGCPYQVAVPAERAGTTRFVTIAGLIGDARTERRRLLAAGRPDPPPRPATVSAAGTLDAFAASYFRAKARLWPPRPSRRARSPTV